MAAPPWQSNRWRSAILLMFSLVFGGCRSVDPISFSPITRDDSWPADSFFQVGELVTIHFGGMATETRCEERVKEDGTITLPDIGVITVTNKTVRELRKELTALYSKYYPSMRLWIGPEPLGHFYYVGGEVRMPGPKAYLGKTTVSTAIQAARDFTEAANKKKVKLIRSDGRSETVVVVDLRNAIQPPNDPPVYPGDKIYVPRKWWH